MARITEETARKLIEDEEQRLQHILEAAEEYLARRRSALARHSSHIRSLEEERLESVSWSEKNELAERLATDTKFDPSKYLVEYTSINSPYFAAFRILDTNPKIGDKTILLGKQSLSVGSKLYVVDWRKAEISALYYEYDEGDEYEETIAGVEREGLLKQKLDLLINSKELQQIRTAQTTLRKVDDVWKAGSLKLTSSQKKTELHDHHLVDIVSLITPEQFRMITEDRTSGIVSLTGGAGCGKTTVAMHRLSALEFKDTESQKRSRNLVVMFNRSLTEYVRHCAKDLLLPETSIETFSSWALAAIYSYSRKSLNLDSKLRSFDVIKRHSALSSCLDSFVKHNRSLQPVEMLYRFYSSLLDLKGTLPFSKADLLALRSQAEELHQEAKERLSFADLGPLLRVYQLTTSVSHEVPKAFRWFDHLLVDEAQDLSAIELEALYASASDAKSLTICADSGQKILSFVDDKNLDTFQMQLSADGVENESLQISYRSGKPILELACKVAKRPCPECANENGEVQFWKAETFDQSVSQTAEWIRKNTSSSSLTAIICKTKHDAKKLHSALSKILLVKEFGALDFSPGVLVTNAHQVKGLEFTNVVLYNPSSASYRLTKQDTNLLYVAITRACEKLYVPYYDELSASLLEFA